MMETAVKTRPTIISLSRGRIIAETVMTSTEAVKSVRINNSKVKIDRIISSQTTTL